MNKISLQTYIPTTVSLSNEDILKVLEKALGIEGYKIIKNILHSYERVDYSEYDYVEVKKIESYHTTIIKKLVDFNCIKEYLL